MGNLMIESGRFLAPPLSLRLFWCIATSILLSLFLPIPPLTHLDAVHLVEGPPVLLVVLGVPEVPAEVVEDAEVVAREAVRHEVVVEVAVPRDRQRDHAALDGHPETGNHIEDLEGIAAAAASREFFLP